MPTKSGTVAFLFAAPAGLPSFTTLSSLPGSASALAVTVTVACGGDDDALARPAFRPGWHGWLWRQSPLRLW
ncbi:hypothetical protein [Streptomyces sp. V3I8]|uniref:hypothetical protein n=1 Tax=Streptomyces sp. V3I8 TaxID=3042279 RepID=UPI0027D85C09|nr:hypothetical protein [Streptomyces sp. V3I8]